MDVGIGYEFSASYTPSQLGQRERDGRNTMSMAQCLLKEAKPPHFFGTGTAATAIYLLNGIPNITTDTEAPYPRLFGQNRGRHNVLSMILNRYLSEGPIYNQISPRKRQAATLLLIVQVMTLYAASSRKGREDTSQCEKRLCRQDKVTCRRSFENPTFQSQTGMLIEFGDGTRQSRYASKLPNRVH